MNMEFAEAADFLTAEIPRWDCPDPVFRDGAFHAVTSVALPEESVWAEMCLFPFGVICAKSRIEFPEQIRVSCD